MRGDGDGVDRRLAVQVGKRIADEVPKPSDIEVRVGAVGRAGFGGRAQRVLGGFARVDERGLGVGLADIDDGDVPERGHRVNSCGTF